MSIICADLSNINEWINLSLLLFPECTYEEISKEYYRYLETENDNREIGFLYQVKDKYVAFMNITIRNEYVNGTTTSPILYIEAIYVMEGYRNQGIGRKLIKYAEEYARKSGIKEIASDCLIDNHVSELFHKSCGFVERERVICFVKEVE